MDWKDKLLAFVLGAATAVFLFFFTLTMIFLTPLAILLANIVGKIIP